MCSILIPRGGSLFEGIFQMAFRDDNAALRARIRELEDENEELRRNSRERTRFVVNGKEYDSLDDLPADMRKLVEAGLEQTHEHFVLNGKEYDSLDELPADMRKLVVEGDFKARVSTYPETRERYIVDGKEYSNLQEVLDDKHRSREENRPTSRHGPPPWAMWLTAALLALALVGILLLARG